MVILELGNKALESAVVSIVTKVRVGFTLALIGLFAMGGGVGYVYVRALRAHHTIICSVLATVGIMMWVLGGLNESPEKVNRKGEGLHLREETPENPLAFLKSIKNWGIILTLATGLVYCHGFYRTYKPRVVQARTKPAIAAKPAVSFPPLQLQGIILHGNRSSALISGHVLFAGEDIDGVQVVAIKSGQVTVTLSGLTNTLELGK